MQVKKNSLRQEPIVHALYNQFKPIKKMSLVSKHSVVVGTDPVKWVFDFEIAWFIQNFSQPYPAGFLPLHGLAFHTFKKACIS